MRLINQIVIHCSATPNGVYISPAQIDAWHAAPPNNFQRRSVDVDAFNRALPHIGYHWVVTADGRLHAGRATSEVGAHVKNHNANSIGICITGTSRFYLRQWDSLASLLADLAFNLQADRLLPADRATYPMSPRRTVSQLAKMGISIVGHRDLSPDINGDGQITKIDWLKICPGFSVEQWLNDDMLPGEAHLLDDHPAIVSTTAAARRENAQ